MSIVIDRSKLAGVVSGEMSADWIWSAFMKDGVDKFWYARVVDANDIEKYDLPSKYFVQYFNAPPAQADGYIVAPVGVKRVALYSKGLYNFLTVGTVLPNFNNITTEDWLVWMGFERDALAPSIAAFAYGRQGGNMQMLICASSGFSFLCRDVYSLLPSDVESRRYIYTVAVFDSHVEFYITSPWVGFYRLLGIAVGSRGGYPGGTIGGPPYAVIVSGIPFNEVMNVLLEMWFSGSYNPVVERRWGITPYWVRPGYVNPHMTRSFRLMQSGSTSYLDTVTIDSGQATSHPLPMSRPGPKTLYFQANQGGTLYIDVFASYDWRVYDSRTVSAGTLLKYTIVDQAQLVRFRFVPSTYPAQIQVAEYVF